MSQTVEQPTIDEGNGDSLVMYKEMLSALSDGELASREMQKLLDFMSSHTNAQQIQSLRQYWFRLHKGKAILHQDFEAASAWDIQLAEKLSTVLASSIEFKDSAQVLDFDKASQRRKSFEEKKKSLSLTQSVAVAASVMLVVLAGWFGTQPEERQNLLARFSSSDTESEQQFFVQDTAKVFRQSGLMEVSAGNISGTQESSEQLNQNFHLDAKRIEQYMMLHAENASLNSNQGIIPFARVSHVEKAREF